MEFKSAIQFRFWFCNQTLAHFVIVESYEHKRYHRLPWPFLPNRGSVRFRTVVEKRAVWEDPQKYLRVLKLKFNKDHGSAIQHDPIIRHATVANLKSRDFDQFQNNMHWCKMWYLGQLSRWDPNLWLIWKLGASARQNTDKNRPIRTGKEPIFAAENGLNYQLPRPFV